MGKKIVKKSFWVHQYEKEEIFLSDMRAKAWKFVNLYKGIPTRYEFEKSEPEEYDYQLDYVVTEEDNDNYHQLYSDMGWEEILPWDGFNGKWYYFCRKKNRGEKSRIYTDMESKLLLIDKLMGTYGVLFLILILLEVNAVRASFSIMDRPGWLWITISTAVIGAISTVILGYMEIGLVLLKNRLLKEKND